MWSENHITRQLILSGLIKNKNRLGWIDRLGKNKNRFRDSVESKNIEINNLHIDITINILFHETQVRLLDNIVNMKVYVF